MLHRITPRLALGAILAVSSALCRAEEPVNLTLSKQTVQNYCESGEYTKDVSAVAQALTEYLQQRITTRKPDEKLALVLDIDETALSNLGHILANDFGYVDKIWHAWVQTARAPAIQPVLELYKTAVTGNVAVIFITGRNESQRIATEKNLREVGYTIWTKTYFRPDSTIESKPPANEYKTMIRKQLTDEGYLIIANMGDQESDLTGGYAEKIFKLPNPLYLIN